MLLQSFTDVIDEVCAMENIVPQEVDVLFCDNGLAVTARVVQDRRVYADLVIPPVCALDLILVLAEVILREVGCTLTWLWPQCALWTSSWYVQR